MNTFIASPFSFSETVKIPVNDSINNQFDIIDRVKELLISSSIALTVSYVNGDGELIVEKHIEANNAFSLNRRRAVDSMRWYLMVDSEDAVWIRRDANGLTVNQGGYIYISMRLEETFEEEQVFLEKTTKYEHCVIAPIGEWVDEMLLKEDISTSTMKKYKSIKNKITKYLVTHKSGVPEKQMQLLCDDLNIKITIKHALFGSNDTMYKSVKLGTPIKVFEFLNSKIDHLHLLTNKGKMSKILLGSQEELQQMSTTLTEEQEPFIYRETHNEIKQIRTSSTNYVINSPLGDYINERKDLYDLNKCEMLIDSDVNRFIQEGSLTNNSVKNGKYYDIISQYQGESKYDIKHIDQIKAYFNYRLCKYFCGFLKKITDFRACEKVMGNGYYYIKDIVIGNNEKLNKICSLLEMFQYNGVYTKPELDWANDRGIKYKIVAGAYGIDGEFAFGDGGLQELQINQKGKKDKFGSFYALTTGIWASNKQTDDWTIDATKDYQKLLVKHKYDVRPRIKKDTATVLLPKKGGKNLCHISGYIYAYQRLGLIEQIEEFENINNIVGIYVDGIYYIENVNILPTFKTKSMDSFANLKFASKFSSRSEVTEETWCEGVRYHHKTELFTGAGGTGKTHRNMMDTGLINPCFCAPTHKLLASKQEEFGDRFQYATWAKLLCGNPIAARSIFNSSVLIIDEVSMMTNAKMLEIIEKYGEVMKIIFIGDVGYQAKPVESGIEFDVESDLIDNHVHLTKQYRTKDEKLSKIIKDMRDSIDKMKGVSEMLDQFQQITEEELTKIYKITDTYISYTNKTANKATQILSKLNDDKRYVMKKCVGDKNTGDVIITDGKCPNGGKLSNCNTVHSFQGVSVKEPIKLFINRDVGRDTRVAHTAVGRAESMEQIYIVNNDTDEETEYFDCNEPNIPDDWEDYNSNYVYGVD